MMSMATKRYRKRGCMPGIPHNTQDDTPLGTNFWDDFFQHYGGAHDETGGFGEISLRSTQI